MIKNSIQEGFILKSKGYYKHAIEAFYKALEVDNSSSELLLEIAESYFLMGEEERAINYIEQILLKDSTHLGSLKLLKKIFLSKSAYKEAEQTAKNIYCISKTEDDLAEILMILNKQGCYKEVFEYEIDTDNPRILYQIAYARFKNNEFDIAEQILENLLSKEITNEALLLKGELLFKTNRKDLCKNVLEKITPEKHNANLLNFTGLVYQYNNDYKNALNYFMAAIKEKPSNDEYYYNCASTYFKMDNIDQAKRYYNLAISLNPDCEKYHFALANLYYSGQHYKRALQELTGSSYESRLLKAIILYDTNYYALAKKEFKDLLEEQPDNKITKEYYQKTIENLGF